VPNISSENPDNISPLVEKFINEEFKKLNSKNKITIKFIGKAQPWLADYTNANFQAGAGATEV
jgi:Cys-Gly metallodipeptidase DUG1